MKRNIGCQSIDHALSRRHFLAGTTAAGFGAAAAIGGLSSPVVADTLKRDHKRILQVYLQGGVSQLESWDPKPGTEYGGPFQTIPTSVPGVHICELLPQTAQRMHLLSIVRSINLKTDDHHQGRLFMEKGRRGEGNYPYVGSVAARYLAPEESPLPSYIHISTRGLEDDTAAFLDARYGQMKLEGIASPKNLGEPGQVAEKGFSRRNNFRQQLNQQFTSRRPKALVDSYDASFRQAAQLMARQELFEKQSEKELDRYGRHDFGRYCLLARTMLEEGSTCVKVTHHGYDTHAENFNFHVEQLGEFDTPFATLLDDLQQRGMLESTLVMVYSEFGRTPKINHRYGRDHWGSAWSIALGGCGLQSGAVIGATNDKGTEVSDREVHGGHLFHTYLQALGIDSTANHDIAGRDIPIGDPAVGSIKELLA